jgi:NADPH-dependent 2,4-dienoyl-CoA reductase/sulfur reductase-like enzyme
MAKARVVVVGAGCAGISAAVQARKAGADVILLERQDQLLGIGRIAGSMDVGGRYPLHLEILEMGPTIRTTACPARRT